MQIFFSPFIDSANLSICVTIDIQDNIVVTTYCFEILRKLFCVFENACKNFLLSLNVDCLCKLD